MTRQQVLDLTPGRFSGTRARLAYHWQCLGCFLRITDAQAPRECPRCQMEGGFFELARDSALSGTRADQASEPQIEYVPASAWKDIWPHGVPKGAVQFWSGAQGAGKSRLGLRLCTDIGVTAAISLEMSAGVTLDTAKSCGADLSRLWLYDSPNAFFADVSAIEPACVIVDSVQYCSKRALSQLIGWCRTTPAVLVLISQVNAQGKPAGGTQIPHAVDAVFSVANAGYGKARIRTIKNRLGLPARSQVYSLGSQ